MRRREALRLVGASTASLAGCLGGLDSGDGGGAAGTGDGPVDTVAGSGSDATPLEATATKMTEPVDPAPGPDEACPTTQAFDVEWPTDVDRDAAEAFVAAYEPRYLKAVAYDYEPETRLDSYSMGGEIPAQAKAGGEGWQIVYSATVRVYEPRLRLTATAATPPAGAEPVPPSDVEDDQLRKLLADAAGVGDPAYQTETDDEDDALLYVEDRETAVPRYLELLGTLSEDFDSLTEPRDSATTYVDVDGTAVELKATAILVNSYDTVQAWYYVDEHVVRRQTDDDQSEEIDSRTGTLVECRQLD